MAAMRLCFFFYVVVKYDIFLPAKLTARGAVRVAVTSGRIRMLQYQNLLSCKEVFVL